MKKQLKKVLALLMCAALLFALTACAGDNGDSQTGSTGTNSTAANSNTGESTGGASGEVKTVTVAIPTSYDLADSGEVQAVINAITAERYGINFEFTFINMGNWQQQSNLLLTGDEVDISAVFSTPLATYVKNGQLVDLTDYYANASDDFKSVWTEDELRGTSIGGKIYAIPNMRNFGNYFGLNIDADIAAEFGIEEGQRLTFEDIDAFFAEVYAKYPDRYMLAPQGTDNIIGEWSWDGLGDTKYLGVLPDCGQDTTVQNLFDTDDFQDFCTWTRKWYQDGYIMQDVLSNTEGWKTMIQNQKAVSALDNYGVNGLSGMIRTVILDAWSVSNSYSALCYGININSKDKEAAFEAMEILYTDAEVSVLLNNGIEDKHFVKNDDGTISFADGKAASEIGYAMADLYWVTPYSATSYPLDVNGPTFFEDLLRFNKEETLLSKGFGFAFDITEVTDQYTACSNVMDKYYKALLSGTVDIESTIAQANDEFMAAGLQDIIDAKQSQLDDFLKNS